MVSGDSLGMERWKDGEEVIGAYYLSVDRDLNNIFLGYKKEEEYWWKRSLRVGRVTRADQLTTVGP